MYSVSGQALPTGSCLLAPPAHAQCQPEGSLVHPRAGTLVSGNPLLPPTQPSALMAAAAPNPLAAA